MVNKIERDLMEISSSADKEKKGEKKKKKKKEERDQGLLIHLSVSLPAQFAHFPLLPQKDFFAHYQSQLIPLPPASKVSFGLPK